MTGKFVWFEYVSNDEKRAQAFYGELFNWKTKAMPMDKGSYTMIAAGDQTIGGYTRPGPGAASHAHWLAHLEVANVKETAGKVKSLGGSVIVEPMKLGDVGTMAIINDPGGAMLALWQSAKAEGGGDYLGIDGTWVWNELYTDDPDKAIAFYKAIGGFESKTMKMGGGGPGPDRYEVLESHGKGRGGIMKLPGVPPNWTPYVKVASTDATVEKAKRLGATFKMPPESIPNVGRIAVFIDPLGAPLGILQPAPM